MKFLSFLKNLYIFFVFYFCALFFTLIGTTPYGDHYIYAVFFHSYGDPKITIPVGYLISAIGLALPFLYFFGASQIHQKIRERSLSFRLVYSVGILIPLIPIIVLGRGGYFPWTDLQCAFWTFVPFFLEALLIALIKKMLKKEQ